MDGKRSYQNDNKLNFPIMRDMLPDWKESLHPRREYLKEFSEYRA